MTNDASYWIQSTIDLIRGADSFLPTLFFGAWAIIIVRKIVYY